MEQIYEKYITELPQNYFHSKANAARQVSDRKIVETKINALSLNSVSIACVLGSVTFLLILAGFTTELMLNLNEYDSKFLSRLVKIFSADVELNIPNFFSMLLMLSASVLLALITILRKKQKADYLTHWAILSFGFLFMAFDEIVSAHEKLVEPTRAFLGGENLGVFYFAWVVPGIALILFLAFFYLRFWWNLPPKTRRAFLIAGAIYVGGAIGMELIGGRHYEIYGAKNITYIVITTIEEGLEMAGLVIFISALTAYIAGFCGEVRLKFDVSPAIEKSPKRGIF